MNRAAVWAGLLLMASCGRTEPPPAVGGSTPSPADPRLIALRGQLAGLGTDVARLGSETASLRRDHDALRAEHEAVENRRRSTLAEIARIQDAMAALAPPPMRATVIAVDREKGVLMIDRGAVHGIRRGDRFDIHRRSDRLLIGRAEVESFAGAGGSTAKLRIVEGKPYTVTAGDAAVDGLLDEAPAAYLVTGMVDDQVMVDRGAKDGVRVGDRLVRDRAELRVTFVDEAWSVAEVVRGTVSRGDTLTSAR